MCVPRTVCQRLLDQVHSGIRPGRRPEGIAEVLEDENRLTAGVGPVEHLRQEVGIPLRVDEVLGAEPLAVVSPGWSNGSCASLPTFRNADLPSLRVTTQRSAGV